MIRTILALIKKELIQFVRDRNMIRILLVMPLVQLFILGYAVNTDVKKIYTAVYDFDRSELSREYVRSLTAGDYLVQKESRFQAVDADQGFRENDYNLALIIPDNFSRDWQTTGTARASVWRVAI